MWFKKKKSTSGIKVELLGHGQETEIVISLKWPKQDEDLQMFREMLTMLNRGMLNSLMISDITERGGDDAEFVVKELQKIEPNQKNRNSRPVPVIPPNKVTETEIKRLNGNF